MLAFDVCIVRPRCYTRCDVTCEIGSLGTPGCEPVDTTLMTCCRKANSSSQLTPRESVAAIGCEPVDTILMTW